MCYIYISVVNQTNEFNAIIGRTKFTEQHIYTICTIDFRYIYIYIYIYELYASKQSRMSKLSFATPTLK